MPGGIRLPNWDELSKDEQIPIINLPLGKNYIVTGPPGTGKSVMAIYRAAKWRSEHAVGPNAAVKLLVYNKPLQLYLRDALKACGLPSATAQTWHSWLYVYLTQTLGCDALPQESPYKYRWAEVEEMFRVRPQKNVFDFLILDEAQDFPPELLRLLRDCSTELTVFADQYQGITDGALSIAEIMSATAPNQGRFYLTRNYRNTPEIAAVADLFWIDDSGMRPAQPAKDPGVRPTVIEARNRNDAIEEISIYGDNNPQLDIGVLVPDPGLVMPYYQGLRQSKQNAELRVQYYSSNEPHNLSFDSGGIKVLSYNTHKGLQFDAVYMPEIGSGRYLSQDTNVLQTKLYVACSRASDSLTFIYDIREQNSLPLGTLRANPELLQWREAISDANSN